MRSAKLVRNPSCGILRVLGGTLLLTFAASLPSFAQDNFNSNNPFGTVGNGPITTNWTTSTLWSGGTPSGTSGDINITNVFLQVTTITNASNSGSLNYLRIWSGDESTANSGLTSNITVITSGGIVTDFGLQLGTKATLIIANTSTFGQNQGASFDLGAGSGGTLDISNGATVFLNFNADIKTGAGGGTIGFVSTSATQTNTLSWGAESHSFTNNSTVVASGTGVAVLTGSNGSNNNRLMNSGTLIVNGGTLSVDSSNAFSAGGFINNGTIIVNSGDTFVEARTTNAWSQGAAPTNNGTIFLNGGTYTTYSDGFGQVASNKFINNGNIIGSGTLAAAIGQTANGSVIASNGVLNILGTYGGQAKIFDNGGAFGTLKAVSGGDLKVLAAPTEKSGAAWTINNGGTLEIAANVALDLGFAFMPAGSLAGVAQVDSGANLTLSSAASGASYSNSTGSSFIFMGGQINTGYASNNPAQFGNYGTLLAVTGNSTFETGSGGGTSSGLGNFGTILATNNGSTFYIEPGNQYYNAFSNAVGSSVVVSNGATVAIQRSAAAWGLQGTGNPTDTNVVNAGNILLNNGTFAMQILGSAVGVGATNQFRNVGAISGQGLVLGTVNNLGSIMANGGGSLVVAGGDASMGFNQGGTLQANAGSTLVMSNASAGSALSFVNAGTVVMNGGSLVAGTIGNSGTILAIGSGSINGTISNLSGGFLSPGAGFGTLNVAGNVDLGSNSTFSVELGLLAGQNDLLNVSSNLTLNANSILDISGGAVGNVYTVATAFAVSGVFGSVTSGYVVNYDPTDITISVPEPSTMFLVIAGLGGIVAFRRRRG